ncbi:DUF2235 domain-containing protein [Rhizobium sp. C4]|uniref:DUF2235 domain-containing protein n=1 Tax=Rhizobium sp. C4 TaxID=1349800 RepID=UPI001E639331|nr:DUF2235 domain-containing protein [Rhizobium sp. C4]MCD2175943.1 DUF2235 domain-containing protein [Rhizobium sp. C4]
MAKNIVILLDGTSNQINGERTNVLRLYGCLKRNETQLVFYQPGVGTFGNLGWWSSLRSKAFILIGLATGAGIDDNVMEAYRFLVNRWEPGDNIYVIGFSRGAYTARLLTGFIRVFGLTKPEQDNLVRYAFRAYKNFGFTAESKRFDDEIEHYQKVLQGKPIRVEFLGLWDTVASVFDRKSRFPWLTLKQKAYTNKNDRIKTVRQALAIDEHRTMFQPSLWTPDQKYQYWSYEKNGFDTVPQDFKEVWFTGCHTDVGGGQPEQKSALAKIPLEWLYREACDSGIKGDDVVFDLLAKGIGDNSGHYVPPSPTGKINESMNIAWAIVEFFPRRILKTSLRLWPRLGRFYLPIFDRRKIPSKAVIHPSVDIRMKQMPDYRPRNLPGDHMFGS